MRQNEEVPRKSSLEWMREDVRVAHLGENSRGGEAMGQDRDGDRIRDSAQMVGETWEVGT